MRRGIIVRKTLLHVDQALLRSCSFAMVEPDAYARIVGGGAGPEYIPVISGFLGSKTWRVKKSETEFLRSLGVQRMLYFLDSRNIKYGDLDAFRTELELLDGETRGLQVFVYVAADFYCAEELDAVIGSLAGTRFSVMLGFGGGDKSPSASVPDVMRTLAGRIASPRLACAFWAEKDLAQSLPTLQELGIQWVAALV